MNPGSTITDQYEGQRAVVRHRWTVALISLTWAWVVVPRVLQSILAPKYRAVVGIATPPQSSVAQMATTVLTFALLGLCIVIVLDTVKPYLVRPLVPLVALLAPWTYMVVRDSFLGDRLSIASLVYPLVVFAAWMLRPRIETLATLGYLTGLAAVVSLGLAVAMPQKGIFYSYAGDVVTEDKVFLPWGILVGFTTHGNILGQFLVLGLPMIGLIARRSTRYALFGVVVFAITWSASRSAMVTIGFALVAIISISVLHASMRKALGPVIALAPWAMVVILPLVTDSPDAFKNRGLIWTQGLAAREANPTYGLGSNWYEEVGRTSERLAGTVFHAHNQFVHVLITGGVVLLVLTALPVIAAALRAGRMAAAGHKIGVVFVATLGGAAMLEVPLGSVVDLSVAVPVVLVPLAFLLFGRYEEPAGLPTEDEDGRPESPVARGDERPQDGEPVAVSAGRELSA